MSFQVFVWLRESLSIPRESLSEYI